MSQQRKKQFVIFRAARLVSYEKFIAFLKAPSQSRGWIEFIVSSNLFLVISFFSHKFCLRYETWKLSVESAVVYRVNQFIDYRFYILIFKLLRKSF